MSTTSGPIQVKTVLAIALGVALLFGGIEIYGLSTGGDWSLLTSTVLWQLLAITLIVSPMLYALVYASHHDAE